MRLQLTLIALAILLSSPAQADPYDSGIKALKRGDTAKAVAKLKRSTRPEAPFVIAQLAEDGKVPGCDLNCALAWYRQAIARDYIPALTMIGKLFWNDNQREKGLAVLKFAARWGDENARGVVGQIGEVVPEPDLLQAELARRQAAYQAAQIEAEQRRVRNEQAMAAMAPALGNLLGCIIAGPDCAYMGPNTQTPYPQVQATYPHQAVRPVDRDLRSSGSTRESIRMCPDGSYVVGECRITPNGTYVGGQRRIAPDGSYVGGQPRLAPDGTYVGGNGRAVLCPDGTYVGGSRCRLAPNGKYVGE